MTRKGNTMTTSEIIGPAVTNPVRNRRDTPTARSRRGVAVWAALCLLTCPAWTTAQPAAAGEHRSVVILTDQKVAGLKRAIDRGGTHRWAWRLLKARVDAGREWYMNPDYVDPRFRNDARSRFAVAAALCYRLTGERRYAEAAFEALKEIHETGGRVPEAGHGLARAYTGLGFGLAYDWSADAWSESQRQYVQEKASRALDAWERFRHPNVGARGSNWSGVCRGSELLLMVGSHQHRQRAQRFNQIKSDLRGHFRNGYDALGASQEGLDYAAYALGLALPAHLALESMGDNTLTDQVNRHAWWRLLMYAVPFSANPDHPHQPVHLTSGVDRPGGMHDIIGWAPVLGTVPEAYRPYFAWWFDRALGPESPLDHERFNDYQMFGVMWALLFYPTDIDPQDPSGEFASGIGGARQLNVFRNQWRGEHDVLLSLAADAHRHDRAWDVPEALQIGLVAGGTLVFGGPGKTGDARHFSTLLVDGKPGADRRTGEQRLFEADQRTGYAIVGGGDAYAAHGVDAVHRHLLVDFRLPGAPAVFTTLDRIRANGTHTYTWQASLGGPESDFGIRAAAGEAEGVPTFTLTTPNGGYVRGWVLNPDATVEQAGDPLRISLRSGDADLWIVMAAGQGAPPAAAIRGEGLEATISVAGRRLRFDPDQGRIVSSSERGN